MLNKLIIISSIIGVSSFNFTVKNDFLMSEIKQKTFDALSILNVAKEINTLEINPIYYLDGNFLGYVHDFEIDEKNCYAILLSENDDLIVSELDLFSSSFYFNKKGHFIYSGCGNYSILNENKVKKVSSQQKYSNVEYNFDISNTTLNKYELKDANYKFSGETLFPSEYTNYCSPVAALSILDYWNYKLENKLLNVNSSDLNNGHLIVNSTSAKNLAIDLYNRFATNKGIIPGTHPFQAMTKLRKFCEEKGFNVELKQLYNSYKFIEEIKKGYPIYMTSLKYDFLMYKNLETLDFMLKQGQKLNVRQYNISNSHAFVAYGSSFYKFNENEDVKEGYEFLKVADGWGYYDTNVLEYNPPQFSYIFKVF